MEEEKKPKFKNLKINKKILAGVVGAIVIASGTAIGTIKFHNDFLENKANTEKEATGYEDLMPWQTIPISGSDYVFFDMGDHDSYGDWLVKSKVEFLDKYNIPAGIVITSDAKNEEEIYNDVDYTKGVLKENDIDLPVYLNINQIMENDNLNVEMKTKIIKDYLEKCSANKIYVGVYGTDTNLCHLKNDCGITGYDAFLIQEDDEIKYDGVYYFWKDKDGKLQKKADLVTPIKDRDLNNPENFKNDAVHVMGEEDISDVSFKYGISVNELLKFNNISGRDKIEVGTEIRIPSVISNTNPTDDFQKVEAPIKGCDISYAQGDKTNWEQVAENFDYVILRCSHGLAEDEYFENNAKSCNVYNIPMGAYCYNEYNSSNTSSLEEFTKCEEQQADKVLECLKNKSVDYPVYLDVEASSIENMDSDRAKVMLETWCNKMESNGYVPGLYCNQTGYNKIASLVDYKLADKLELWIAGGDQYTSDKTPIDVADVVPSSVLNNEEIGANMAQSTDSCVNGGAGNGAGHLDVNFTTVDYLNPEVQTEEQQLKKFDNKMLNYPIQLGAAGVAVVGLGVLGIRKLTKKKVKEKTKTKE